MKPTQIPVVKINHLPKVEIGHIAFQDVPGFGFEVLIVNGQHIYIACGFVNDQIVRNPSSPVFLVEADAMAFKEQVKRDRITPKIIVPGTPQWNLLAVPNKR